MSVNKGIYFDKREKEFLLTNGTMGSYINPFNKDWNRFYIDARVDNFYWTVEYKSTKNWEALGPLDIMIWSE